MITVNNLTKKFGEKVVVDIPELHISRGEAVGLVGNNGAGKTSFFRLILDLYQTTTGEILNHGKNVAKSEEWKDVTAAFVDNGFLIDFLTPEEYFEFLGSVRGIDKGEIKNRLEAFDKFMNGEILGKKKYIRNFSSGNKQKIGIIGAMIAQPDILILDEPFNFLDPSSQIEIKRILKRYNANLGTTIILSSHNLEHMVEVSNRVLLMENGKIIKDLHNENGEVEDILKSYFETL
ncbi:MAG: ABC transporter ATP-binding protein [Marinilabiliaceae bacterium]|nr:ABC transporter ATP-binding protein [Marinilabiliaceae bacterium]